MVQNGKGDRNRTKYDENWRNNFDQIEGFGNKNKPFLTETDQTNTEKSDKKDLTPQE